MVEPHSNFPDSEIPAMVHSRLVPLQDRRQAFPHCCPLESPGELLKLLMLTSYPVPIQPGRVFLRTPRWFPWAATFQNHWTFHAPLVGMLPSRPLPNCPWLKSYVDQAHVPSRACCILLLGDTKVSFILVASTQEIAVPGLPLGRKKAL